MHDKQDFKPAAIGKDCCDELCRMEAELSAESEKDLVLVAYEKKQKPVP